MRKTWLWIVKYFMVIIRYQTTIEALQLGFTNKIYPFAPGVKRRPGVYIEKWEGIDTYSVDKLMDDTRYPYLPTWRGYGSQFTQPRNWGENFGTRIRAYFVPKDTGTHIFYIASDNGGHLYLSKDEQSEHKSLIARVSAERFTKPKEYDKYPEQKSWPVQLEKGKYYFIETLMKEYFDDDHLSVAVKTPDDKFYAPIPSPFLWTAVPSSTPDTSRNATAQIILLKYAAKFGARAGASSGSQAAYESGAKAGAEAGARSGEQAGAKAGAEAAAIAARKIITKAIDLALQTYAKHQHHVVFNVHTKAVNGAAVSHGQTGSSAGGQAAVGAAGASAGSSATGGSSNYGRIPGVGDHMRQYKVAGIEPMKEGAPFGSSGLPVHPEALVSAPQGKAKAGGSVAAAATSSGKEASYGNKETSTSSSSSSSSSVTSSSSSSSTSASSLSSNVTSNSSSGPEPVFTTILSGNNESKPFTGENAPSSGGSNHSRESTRESAKFVYYPKPGEDPDDIARALVYDEGPASKVVFNAHYSIHSLDVPAIQINMKRNLCFRSIESHVALRGACQYFIIREGLLPKTNSDDFSLQSACVPDHYIVQRNYRFFLAKRDGTLHFAREATFLFYKIMTYPSALQIMSFYHYLWFACEDKIKNLLGTEMVLAYTRSTKAFLTRCSFNFLPIPKDQYPTLNCKGVLSNEIPTIPGQEKLGPPMAATVTAKTAKKPPKRPLNETCIALNFINHAGRPYEIVTDIKADGYLAIGKEFKLKTIIQRPDLHHHVTYRALDPRGEKVMLLFGDTSITVVPTPVCDEFIPIKVTSQPGHYVPHVGMDPYHHSLTTSTTTITTATTARPTEKPAQHLHYHYHPEAAPAPAPQPLFACPSPCISASQCPSSCPSHCCKRNEDTNKSLVPAVNPNLCLCEEECKITSPNNLDVCLAICKRLCNKKEIGSPSEKQESVARSNIDRVFREDVL